MEEEYDVFEIVDKYILLYDDFCQQLTGSNITRSYRGQMYILCNQKQIFMEIPRNADTNVILSELTQLPCKSDEEIDRLLLLYHLEVSLTKIERDLPQYLNHFLDFYSLMMASLV